MTVKDHLRIFVSSPADVKSAREMAALTIERLAQDYARFLKIEPYLWEYEAMVASGHFQDSIEPPSAFDIVVLILWSRLGMHLPTRTLVREYRGIDGRSPVTGTEWEFEEALQSARQYGTPDILVYRKRSPASVDLRNSELRGQQLQQLTALELFWSQHFDDQGVLTGAYTEFDSDGGFAGELEKHLRKLIEKRIAAIRLGRNGQTPRAWLQEPFRGLESYEFEHAPIFFGQDEALTKAMVQLLAHAEAGIAFLLVLGASGSGKSSLVRAGIVPKLFVPRRVPGAAFLRRVLFRPSDAQEGEDIFEALARRLTLAIGPSEGLPELIGAGQSVANLAAHLRNSAAEPAYPIGTALGQLTAATRRDGRMLEYQTARLVLIIDQLEELYTNERITPQERRRFIELLVSLARSGLVWVIATIRKDFWHQADDTPELAHIAEGNGRLELLPPKQAQLSQMIQRPAAAAGIGFEYHSSTNVPLNEVIAEEVAHEPGALPLLSYLLDQLYRADVLEGRGATLTFATYERLGRLEGAIATKAEAVLDKCAPEDRQALGSVLFSLVQMGSAEGHIERAVSRRVPLSIFPPGTPQRRLVEALLHPDARLLVSDAEQGGHPTVRVAHEALITHWSRARDFVHGNAHALKIRRRIEERYAIWSGLRVADKNTKNPPGRGVVRARLWAWRARFGHEIGLLSEIDLIDGERLLREHRSDSEPHLVDYIERSSADDRRIRNRSVRVLTAVASVVTVLAILASGAGLLAVRKQHEAQVLIKKTLEAQSRSLTEAAMGRLKDGNISGAQGIILEVLTNRYAGDARSAAAINVFQEARAEDKQLAVLSGHSAAVYGAAFSPDGRRIVSASRDNSVRIWDAASGAELTVLSGHEGMVNSASFSPDGSRIITASRDKTARVWDSASGAQLAVLRGHDDVVQSAEFSSDGQQIVTASWDQTTRIWDAASGAQLKVLQGPKAIVHAANFSFDGRHIVTASHDGNARIWDARTGLQLAMLSGHGDSVLSAAYSPDGRRVLTASRDKTARIWDSASGNQIVVLSGHSDVVESAKFSSDGHRIVTAGRDHTVRVWDADSGMQLAVLNGHDDLVFGAAFSPDGRRIVSASRDKTVRIWDATNQSQLAVLSGHEDIVESAVIAADGMRILTASEDHTARIWDASTGIQLTILSGPAALFSAAFSHDGQRVVTTSEDKTARIWDSATAARLTLLSGHLGIVYSGAFSPDGQRVVTGSEDKSARIWNASSGAQLALLTGHGGIVYSVSYSSDGRRILTSSEDSTARIWDAGSGVQVAVLSGHIGPVGAAAFSPDGQRIVTASHDRTARIWDAASGVQLAVLLGHSDSIFGAAFSPDGRRVVTASRDQTARIWDAVSGAQLEVLSGHTGIVQSAVFSPDGRRIVTSSNDRTARVWDAQIPLDLSGQIAWSQAAQIDEMSGIERTQLGLQPDEWVRTWPPNSSKCDQMTAAPYDPDRLAPGVAKDEIVADVASPVCTEENAKSGNSARTMFQMARVLVAKNDAKRAKDLLETSVSQGYRAAQIDLAVLLAAPGEMFAPDRALTLYKKAWQEGVLIAAYELGNLYEHGTRGIAVRSTAPQPEPDEAWEWYKMGADAGEPNALARYGKQIERSASAETSLSKKNDLLLKAFGFYAAAAERAHDEDWPDSAWKDWRYHRATLARLLAREGMTPQVAAEYVNVRNQSRKSPPRRR